eukprot:Sspe_Gene.66907::Locus_39522_Transcript_1_1_Confidence_1.000_Length_2852::g.66907::m.66907/K00503/DBH; dopamine beta-monooxygenase
MRTVLWAAMALALPLLARGVAVVGCDKRTDGVMCHEFISRVYAMTWVVDEGAESINITLHRVVATGSPWMGVGVSTSGGMKGADLMVAHKDSRGGWVVDDMFAYNYEPPVLDKHQHVSFVGVVTSGGVVSVSFTRPLDSCEFFDNSVEKGIDHRIVWAIGEGTDLSSWGSQHSQRGTVQLRLWEDELHPPYVAKDEGLFTVDVQMPGVEIPHNVTNTYMCMTFDLAELTGKDFDATHYHLVSFTSKIKGGDGLVHHMLLTTCLVGMVSMFTKVNTECPAMDALCPNLIGSWGVGGAPVTLPDEAGLGIGGANGRMLWLQVHYFNPSGEKGKVDFSGMSLQLTPKLRKFEAAMFTLGTPISPTMPPIPPGKDRHLLKSQCAECMPMLFENEEVKVLYGAHHAHFKGHKVTTEVVRDGKNIGPLINQKRFDYSHQFFVQPRITTLRKTDILQITCEYNTLSSEAPTHFGDGSDQEMCFTFAIYYPRQPRVSWCFDLEWLGVSEYDDNLPKCQDCKANGTKWAEKFAVQLAEERGCDNPKTAPARVPAGICPPCARTVSCTVADYLAFWDPLRNMCEHFCALSSSNSENMPYHCSPSITGFFSVLTAGKRFDFDAFPKTAECSPKTPLKVVDDDCKVHGDCGVGRYCRNGRKLAVEAEGPLRCMDCALCCKREDAVGAGGETDRLYRCPASCGCGYTVESCAREGEVLCRGCCAREECKDDDYNGGRLLGAMGASENCTGLRRLVDAGQFKTEAVEKMCKGGVSTVECTMLGMKGCVGAVFLYQTCPVLCGSCPRCSLDAQCSRCTAPGRCTSDRNHLSDTTPCMEATCPAPITTTPTPAPSAASLRTASVSLFLAAALFFLPL